METTIIESTKTKKYSLSGGQFFKENPDKMLAEPFETTGKFGKVINYRPKKDISPIEVIKDIQAPDFIAEGVVDASVGKSVIAEPSDSPVDPDDSMRIERSIEETKKDIIKSKAKKQKELSDWEEPPLEDLLSFEQVLKDYNPHLTMDEIKVFLWYQHSIGNTYKKKWLNIFNPSEVKESDELLMINSWAKQGLIMYFEGEWIPKVIYLSGNLYEKKVAFESEKKELAAAYGQDIANIQEKNIEEVFKQIYDARLKLDDPEVSRRLKLKPFSEFAKSIMIGNWEKDSRTGEPEEFLVPLSQSEKSYGKIYWKSKKTSISRWDRNAAKYLEMSLADAFRYWLKYGDPGPMPYNFNWQDIFDYYLDKVAKNNMDPTVLARNRAYAKDVGEKLFSRFCAEVILENDRVKIEYEWNRKFNANLNVDYDKIPIAFKCAKFYPGNEQLDIRPEKREAVAFHVISGSSLNAYGVGYGKTWASIFIIAQSLDAGHCDRPVIIVPNQVYKQFYSEIRGILPHVRINDLYNLSKDYLDQFRDENGQIMSVEAGSISIMTYQGFERIGFNDDTQVRMENQLSDAISMLMEIDLTTKKGQTDIVKEKQKLGGIIGKALAKSIVDVEDLGFDFVTFDEAHALKKVFTQVKARKAEEGESKGKKMYEISSGIPSTRGIKGYFLCSYIQMENRGRNVLLLTATPFTNSPLEVYSMLSLVAYQHMSKIGLSNINDFFDNFCQMSNELVINSRLQPERKQIFKGFDNLIGLQKLIYSRMLHKEAGKPDAKGNVITIKRPDKWVLPYKGRMVDDEFIPASDDEFIDTVLTLSDLQKQHMERIISYVEGKIQYEQLGDVKEIGEDLSVEEIVSDLLEDNPEMTEKQAEKEAKKIIKQREEDILGLDEYSLADDEKAGVRTLRGVNFARSVSLSPYLYEFSGLGKPTYKTYIETSPKLKYIMECVRSVKKWHEQRSETVSGQVIYMDRGKKYFELIKGYLIEELGYKDHEIGIIRSGKEGTSTHKDFVKNGFNGLEWNESLKQFRELPDEQRIKIVIGTGSIKEGMNLQKYSTVLYNAFVDWNPTDQQQLEGRCWRQGNTFKNVRIVIPLMADSMDIFMFQKLEEKTSRINSIWNYDGVSNVLPVEELDPQEQKMALVTNPRVIAQMESERDTSKIAEDISFHESNKQTASNVIDFIRTRNNFIEELEEIIAIIAPEKSGSRIEVLVSTFEKALEKGKVGDKNVDDILRNHPNIYRSSFVDYNRKLTKPWNYGTMKGSVAMVKKAKEKFLDKYKIDVNIEAIQHFIQTEQDKITGIRQEEQRLKSDGYLDQRATEIEQERKEKKIRFATVPERVKEFEKLNRLLEFKVEESPKKATEFVSMDIEGCPPITEDGKRDISPSAIKKLEACIANLPATKALHVDQHGNYTPERQKLHKLIKAKVRERSECVIGQKEPIVVLMGGPPGSGKTTYLKKYAPFLTKERVFKIDADEIRAMLPEYEGWNSSATHQETQDIYRSLLDDISKGEPCTYDILWDGTMNKPSNYKPLIGDLKRLGYKIYIIYVKVPAKISIERALKRYENPNNEGRYVPMDVVKEANARGDEGFNKLKPTVDGFMLIDGVSGNIVEKGGEQIIEGRGYFDREATDKDRVIKRKKKEAEARKRKIQILSLQ